MTPFNPSVISFLFLKFAIIAGGYVTQIIPCQTQRVLENNIFSKHIIGFLLAFAFIMLEGGWGFNEELEKSHPDNDWSNGNALESMVFAHPLSRFLLTAKMENLSLISYYMLYSSHYTYLTPRKIIGKIETSSLNNKIILMKKIIDYLIYISIAVGVYVLLIISSTKKNHMVKISPFSNSSSVMLNVVTKLFKYFLIIFK